MADTFLNRQIAKEELDNLYNGNDEVAKREFLINYITELLDEIDDLQEERDNLILNHPG